MLVVAVRHAESLHNAAERDEPDTDLSATGRAQAERIAARLGAASVRAIYASPYRRAIQTARPLADALDLPILLRGELCEAHLAGGLDLRGFELPNVERLRTDYPRVRADPDGPAELTWPPLAETLDAVVERQRRLTAALRARWTKATDLVVLFGHGLPIARFIEAWLVDAAGPNFRFVIENAALTCLREVSGVSSLLFLNESSHLVGLSPARGSLLGSLGGVPTDQRPAW